MGDKIYGFVEIDSTHEVAVHALSKEMPAGWRFYVGYLSDLVPTRYASASTAYSVEPVDAHFEFPDGVEIDEELRAQLFDWCIDAVAALDPTAASTEVVDRLPRERFAIFVAESMDAAREEIAKGSVHTGDAWVEVHGVKFTFESCRFDSGIYESGEQSGQFTVRPRVKQPPVVEAEHVDLPTREALADLIYGIDDDAEEG